MGRSFLYECPKCGYKAGVAGGADRGFDVAVQTIVCRDCKRLYDAVVRLRVAREAGHPLTFGFPRLRLPRGKRSPAAAPTFDAALNRLSFPGARPFHWVQFKLSCPVLATHRVQVWAEPGKCPQCATHLEKNPLPFRIWD